MWYLKYPELIEGAGRFPYPYKPGSIFKYFSIKAETGAAYYHTVPGVMALDWVPSVGNVTATNDAINIAGKEMYAKIRRAYSSSLDADAPDLIIYMMALDSIFTYIAYLKRVYRLLNAYRPDNYDMPDALLRAMGFTADEITTLRVNKTQFWQMINELTLQSRKFTCPNVMDVFKRHYWMSDETFTDAATWNSQFYIFNLAGVFRYTATAGPGDDSTPGLEMVRTPWVGNPTTRATITPTLLYSFGVDLLNALILWDDSYTINGYFMRAFEGTPNFIVEEISQDTIFEAKFSEEVLTQIENSFTVCGGLEWINNATGVANLNVWQEVNSNIVQSVPSISIATNINENWDGEVAYRKYATVLPYINLRSQMPTAIDNTIATRLKAISTVISDPSGTGSTVNIQCATEIPLSWRLIANASLAGNVYSQDRLISQTPIWDSTKMGTPAGLDYSKYFRLSHFDWHPTVFIVVTNMNATNWENDLEDGDFIQPNIVGDIHNETIVSEDDIRNLHKVCTYSEFNAFSIT